MKILVTGSRGFIGGSFGVFAARAGHEVLGISRSSQAAHGWPAAHLQADVAQADLAKTIRDFAPDLVLHGAGSASVGHSLNTPLDDLKASLLTWATVLDGVRRSGLKPVVLFPSSAAVYGNPAHLPVREDAPSAPISPYGFHKMACELAAREYAQCFGLRIIVCRLFSVFGPGQRRLLVWEIFRQLLTENKTVWLDGSGEETRDYLHVDDASAAMLQLGAQPSAEGCVFVNVASGRELSVRALAERLCVHAGVEKNIECRHHHRPGDPLHWRADTARLTTMLPDWRPRDLEESLAECAGVWLREKGAVDA